MRVEKRTATGHQAGGGETMPVDMMPPIWCDLCGDELTEPGALIFSPPNERHRVGKFHICTDCWADLGRTLQG